MKHPVRLAVVSTVLGATALSAGAVYAASPPSPGSSQPGSSSARSEFDARGVLTAISSTSLTLRADDGEQLTYRLTGDTTYRGGPGRDLQRSYLAVGDRVHVRGEQDGNGRVARSVEARPAHLDGTVTAVGSDTVTLVDRDGFTRTVRTSGDTVYVEDGETTSRSALTDGEHVRAQGRVASDGTSLQADRVEVGEPTPPAGGPGKGGPGKGGPGSGGPGAGPAPSGAPSAAPSPSGDSLGS